MQTYDKATVLIENGKIKAVGPDVQVPSDAEIIDAAGCWVTPGLIDCHTHICNFSEPNSMPGLSDGNEMTGPIQPHIRALDAVYPDDYAIDKVREAGFTTVYSTPGSGNVIGGTGVSIKLRGHTAREMALHQAARPHRPRDGHSRQRTDEVCLRRKPQAQLRCPQADPCHPHGPGRHPA